MAWHPGFETAFDPKAIAVVGVSPEGGMGTAIVIILQQYGYSGHIYPINPRLAPGELQGFKVYPDLVSVPEPTDLVIICVPAAAVPAVLQDCIAANARNVHIFTAGFEETGEEEGIVLGQEIRRVAESGGLRIVGPNSYGLQVPAARVATIAGISPESGPVAFISQSGGHAIEFTGAAPTFGLRFSKVISYGNAAGFDCTDFLEYLATDNETKIITMYLEGLRDGHQLLRLVREANKTKPVIIWKGGLTESGAKACASHTGALAGREEVWQAFFRQTGAIRVDNLQQMGDVAMAFLYLRPPRGRRP